MNDKILIVGRAGTGKTTLANMIQKATGYNVVDGIRLETILAKNEPETIYVSNAIEPTDMKSDMLSDFTVIEIQIGNK